MRLFLGLNVVKLVNMAVNLFTFFLIKIDQVIFNWLVFEERHFLEVLVSNFWLSVKIIIIFP